MRMKAVLKFGVARIAQRNATAPIQRIAAVNLAAVKMNIVIGYAVVAKQVNAEGGSFVKRVPLQRQRVSREAIFFQIKDK
jgi:hypothetical protein